MSSARKRAAIQKANNEAEFLRQKLRSAEVIGSMWKTTATLAAHRADTLHAAMEKIASRTQSEGLLWWQIEARDALAKVGAGDTAAKGSNVEITGAGKRSLTDSGGSQG